MKTRHLARFHAKAATVMGARTTKTCPSHVGVIWMFCGLLLLGACGLPGDDSGLPLPPCDCPNLIRVVESVDWVPGVTGRQSDASALDDQTSRGVTYHFEVPDPEAEVQRLQTEFEDSGLSTEEDFAVHGFRSNGSGYGILISELEGQLRLRVALLDGTPDEEADEILRPVIEAVGLRD